MPPTRQGLQLPSEVKPFGIVGFLGLLVRATVAYVFGFALYIGIFRVSRRVGPILTDAGLSNFALFLLIALAVAAILLVVFQPMWSTEMRGFGLMTSFTIVAIAFAQAAGLTHMDAMAPIEVLVRQHIEVFAGLRR
jgi:hypothetical protein